MRVRKPDIVKKRQGRWETAPWLNKYLLTGVTVGGDGQSVSRLRERESEAGARKLKPNNYCGIDYKWLDGN